MRISEKDQQIEIWDFFMNDKNIMLGYTRPIGKTWKSKNVNKLILMNVQNSIFIDPFPPKDYNLFSQDTENSLEE